MFKKIISVLCLVALISSLVFTQTFASTKINVTEEANVLKALGILAEKTPSAITYDTFFGALSRFISDDGMNPESFARGNGCIEKGYIYNAKQRINSDEAVKAVIKILGYGAVAEHKGYLSVASELGIDEVVNLSSGKSLTYEDFIALLYSILDLETMQTSAISGDRAYDLTKDQPLITLYRDIYIIEGVETSNGVTSLDKVRADSIYDIAIDNIVYHTDGKLADLLGENVCAYIKRADSADNEVLYLKRADYESRVKIVNDIDIIGVKNDFSEFKYYDENEKERSLKLSPIMKVIYNGEFYPNYTVSDFSVDNGSISFIDNNRDGTYDVIKITSYDVMIAGSIDYTEYKITAKYKLENHISVIDLDDDIDSVYYISNGYESIDFSSISSGDVLTVAVAKSVVNPVCSIIVSKDYIQGTYTERNNNDETITVDEEVYKVNNIADLYLQATNMKPELGNNYTYYLDSFGRIVFYQQDANSDYAVFYKVCKPSAFGGYAIKFYNISGNWIETDFAEKVYINGKPYSNSDSKIESNLNADSGKVMLIKLNAKGQVKSIEKYTETDTWGYPGFSKTYEAEYAWRGENKSFQCELYADTDCKLFIIPTDPSDFDAYVVREATGFFKANTNYKVCAYDTDKFGFTKLLSYNYDGVSLDSSEVLFVVTGKSTVMANDDVVATISGNGGGYRNLKLLGSDVNTFDAYEIGDVLTFNMGSDGRVASCNKICSLKNALTPSRPSNYHVSNCIAIGTVKEIDASNGRMLIDFGTSSNSFRISDTVSVQKFLKADDICELSNVAAIMEEDDVVCRIKSSQLLEIIICR